MATATPGERHWDFFVAYAGPDAPIAAHIAALLEAGGATVFLDANELFPGDVWPRVLAHAQKSSAVTVILVSNNTGAAYYQLEELAAAVDMSRRANPSHRVAPVYLEQVERVPYGLRVVHGLWALNDAGIRSAAAQLLRLVPQEGDPPTGRLGGLAGPEDHDVSICHAAEDKVSIAQPLAHALRKRGIQVWYDEFSIAWGDSLRQKIDEGVATCRYGLVILSPDFFAKNWPQYELDGLIGRELATGSKVILPIWHGVEHGDVARYSPPLAERSALRSSRGVDAIATEVQERLASEDKNQRPRIIRSFEQARHRLDGATSTPTTFTSPKTVQGSLPGGPGAPTLELTSVPAIGTHGDLIGRVMHVDPAKFRVVTYIRLNNRYRTKPHLDTPTETIGPDGRFRVDITPESLDEHADLVVVYVVPASYKPPLAKNSKSLPAAVAKNAVAFAQTSKPSVWEDAIRRLPGSTGGSVEAKDSPGDGRWRFT